MTATLTRAATPQPAIRPAAEWELQSLIADAAARGRRLEIMGAGTKRGVGHDVAADARLTTTGLTGITLYEPTELVMSARAGTPLRVVEAELAGRGQMLAFEPIDLGPALGIEPGHTTIGGVFATNLSGARRIFAGAARDHLLGVKAINGRGESFKSGGRVMKNVTGLDVARALCGSWGTLAVMTEVTFKVQPVPETLATLVLRGLPDELAIEVMTLAHKTPCEVTGSVHLDAALAGRLWHAGLRNAGRSVTALRLETFAASLAYRVDKLKAELKPYGSIDVLDPASSHALWDELRQVSVLQASTDPVWRISTAPRLGPTVAAGVARYMPTKAFYDWSGGLLWLEVEASADAGATDIRRVVATHGGHATLVRAAPEVRAAIDVFQPLEPGAARLSRHIKAAFDPAGILSPGRMVAEEAR